MLSKISAHYSPKYFSIIVGSTCRESVCYAYYVNMFILFLLVIIIKGEYNISYM